MIVAVVIVGLVAYITLVLGVVVALRRIHEFEKDVAWLKEHYLSDVGALVNSFQSVGNHLAEVEQKLIVRGILEAT